MFFAWTLFDGGELLQEKREKDCCEHGPKSNNECGSYDVLDISDDYPPQECSLNSFEEANICCPDGTFGVDCAVSCGVGRVCVPERGGLGSCRPSCVDKSLCNGAPQDCYRDTDKGEDTCFCPFGTVQDPGDPPVKCLTQCSETVPCRCEDDNPNCGLVCVPNSAPTEFNAQASLQGVCQKYNERAIGVCSNGRNGLNVAGQLYGERFTCACPLGHYKLEIDIQGRLNDKSTFDCYQPCTSREDCPNDKSYKCNYAKRFDAKVCVPQEKCESNINCPRYNSVFYEYCQLSLGICHPPCGNEMYEHCKKRGALCYKNEYLKDQCYCAREAEDDGTCKCEDTEDCPPNQGCDRAGFCRPECETDDQCDLAAGEGCLNKLC